jgi:Fic family protein
MIKMPPPLDPSPFSTIVKEHGEKIGEYLELNTPLDDKGRYLPYHELRHRIPKDLNHGIAWSIIKLARHRQLSEIIKLGAPSNLCKFMLTPAIQMATSESDRHTTNAALEWMSSKIGEAKHVAYLLGDLIEDEAISSSQLEGAATTTKVAKDLLKRKRAPRTPDEKMIVGNYRMMQYAWQCRNKELSVELIAELHQVGVESIDDEKYHPGAFRVTDDVVVEDGDGEIVHTPPPAKGLEKRLALLADWINTHHSDVSTKNYIHPLVKAVVLHFAIGYEHPFHDGNGRVARSLFYWYMFRHDFAAFRYIAISKLLKQAPIQYGMSYVYTETDDMDLTYFVDYQARIIIRAISEFKTSYEATAKNIEKFNSFLFKSGLFGKLTDKQKIVLQVAKGGQASLFTAVNVKDNLNCSYNTANSVLNGLVDLNLFRKEKKGREWVFSMLPTREIIEGWKS